MNGILWRAVFFLVVGVVGIGAQTTAHFGESQREKADLFVARAAGEPVAALSAVKFRDALDLIHARRGWREDDFCDARHPLAARILREYGAVFVAADSVSPPPVCIFSSSEQVGAYQKSLATESADFDGTPITLQKQAMIALIAARAEAKTRNLKITPRDGIIAGHRSFADTARLWNSRFEPACDYWLKRRRLTVVQVSKLKSLPANEQIVEVLRLESFGIFFNTTFNDSILRSVAAPGTSQHLSLLAFDAAEYDDPQIRRILAKHGWYRTIRNDLPHFTFLGHPEGDLQFLGLKNVRTARGEFWIPNL